MTNEKKMINRLEREKPSLDHLDLLLDGKVMDEPSEHVITFSTLVFLR